MGLAPTDTILASSNAGRPLTLSMIILATSKILLALLGCCVIDMYHSSEERPVSSDRASLATDTKGPFTAPGCLGPARGEPRTRVRQYGCVSDAISVTIEALSDSGLKRLTGSSEVVSLTSKITDSSSSSKLSPRIFLRECLCCRLRRFGLANDPRLHLAALTFQSR